MSQGIRSVVTSGVETEAPKPADIALHASMVGGHIRAVDWFAIAEARCTRHVNPSESRRWQLDGEDPAWARPHSFTTKHDIYTIRTRCGHSRYGVPGLPYRRRALQERQRHTHRSITSGPQRDSARSTSGHREMARGMCHHRASTATAMVRRVVSKPCIGS